MASFHVNLESIEKKFPKTMTVPPLLRELAPWIAKQKHGSLGYFEAMQGGKFNDGSIPPESNKKIAAATGIFMVFGEGSELALWKHDEKSPLAVVLIDSEGQNRTVAGSFEQFLEAWSKQKTGLELDDDTKESKHAELAAWLKKQKVKADKATAPDFGKWVSDLSKVEKPSTTDFPAPPKDMVPRILASFGKTPTDKTLAALLGELGIDFKKYKTADQQRNLNVTSQGYTLRFNKKQLEGIEMTNENYECWSNGTGRMEKFKAFPCEIREGTRVSDDIATVKKKLGPPVLEYPDRGLYYWDVPNNVRLMFSFVAPDKTDGPVPPNQLAYVWLGLKK